MSVRNGEAQLERAIDSILGQSMSDLEFLIADDMSTDGTAEILCRRASEDQRIRIIVNYQNLGLTRSLNNLIEISRGDFIARIDADDTARSDRLERQIAAMDEEDSVMCCSCYRAIDESRSVLYSHCPHTDPAIMKWSLVFRNNIRHSTVIWRRSVGLSYDERHTYAQDYDMWCRMARKGRISVVAEPLADVMLRTGAITIERRAEQDMAAASITASQFKYYTGREISNHEAQILRLTHYLKDQVQFEQFGRVDQSELERAARFYTEVLESFCGKEDPDAEMMMNEIKKDLPVLMGIGVGLEKIEAILGQKAVT